jgi:predicted naringenin-chalcone synthase
MTALLGLGVAVPEHSMDQSDAVEMALALSSIEQSRERAVGALYRRTGVRRRHCVILNSTTDGAPAEQDFFQSTVIAGKSGPSTARRMRAYERTSPELAYRASAAALARADMTAEEITHLVTCTCTGFSAPGYDLSLIEELPLSPDVQRTQVGFMGCHGALNALRVARAFCTADSETNVLVCATELCSLHFQYSDEPQTIVSNALFGDGSAAVVLTGRADVPDSPWRLKAHGSTVLPGTSDAMSWRIGNHGFKMRLSPRAPELIQRRLAPWLDGWLAKRHMTRDDIGSWAIHPGGPRILEACADALHLREDALDVSWHVLSTFGNMSSPTVLFILDELQRRGAELPAVVMAFGPGLTVEAALLM